MIAVIVCLVPWNVSSSFPLIAAISKGRGCYRNTRNEVSAAFYSHHPVPFEIRQLQSETRGRPPECPLTKLVTCEEIC